MFTVANLLEPLSTKDSLEIKKLEKILKLTKKSERQKLDIALKADIVKKTGAWYSFDGAKIGQGRENVKIALKDDEKLYQSIEDEVKKFLGSEEDED